MVTFPTPQIWTIRAELTDGYDLVLGTITNLKNETQRQGIYKEIFSAYLEDELDPINTLVALREAHSIVQTGPRDYITPMQHAQLTARTADNFMKQSSRK